MRNTLLIFALISCGFVANAQTKKADSLIFALKRIITDTSRIKTYNLIASELLKGDMVKSESYSDSAITLAKKNNFYKGILVALRLKGIARANRGEFVSAKNVFTEETFLALHYNIEKEIVRGYNNLSTVSNSLNEFDSAIYYAQKSLSIDSGNNNKKLTYSASATAYRHKGDYASSLSYHLKNIALCKAIGDKNMLAKIQVNVGNLYAVMKQFDDAIRYYEEAIKIFEIMNLPVECVNLNMGLGNVYSEKNEFAQAESHYNLALQQANKLGLKSAAAHLLHNIGNMYADRKLYGKSLDYYKQARVLVNEVKDENLQAQLNIGLAYVYISVNRINEAEKEAHEGLARANKLHLSSIKAQAYDKLHRIDSIRGDYRESLINYKRAQDIKDSLFTIEKSKQIAEIEKKYEVEKKSKEIQELQREVEKKQAQVTQSKYRLYTLGSLLAALVLGFALVFLRARNKRESKEREEVIQKQKEVMLAQEEIQEKISRDLHDDIGQKMIALKMDMESNVLEKTALQMPLTLLNEITSDIRNLSHALSPQVFQTDGLQTAFDKLLSNAFHNSSIQCSFEKFNLKSKYPYEIEINVYRIGQELIANILKHANARNVAVQLYENATHLILITEDDGKGFDASFEKGFGLGNIEARSRMLKGIFHYESAVGKTISTFRVPV